jgi:hypothetical protein
VAAGRQHVVLVEAKADVVGRACLHDASRVPRDLRLSPESSDAAAERGHAFVWVVELVVVIHLYYNLEHFRQTARSADSYFEHGAASLLLHADDVYAGRVGD